MKIDMLLNKETKSNTSFVGKFIFLYYIYTHVMKDP